MSGERSSDLLAELAKVFQHLSGENYLYLPRRKIVEGATAAIQTFADHVDVYFKFLARCKPKGTSRDEFEEQLVGLLGQLPLIPLSEEELAACADQPEEEVEVVGQVEFVEKPEVLANETIDIETMQQGWLRLSREETERRMVLNIRLKSKKAILGLDKIIPALKAGAESVKFAWEMTYAGERYNLKCEVVYASPEAAASCEICQKFNIGPMVPLAEARIAYLAKALQPPHSLKFIKRMSMYLEHSAGTHHFPAKVLLTHLPEYLAAMPSEELADTIEKRLGEAGWAELLLSVKMLRSTGLPPLSREIILTFYDAASAADFASDTTSQGLLSWPPPNASSDTGPSFDKYLLSDVQRDLETLTKREITVPDPDPAEPNRQVLVLLSKKGNEEREALVDRLCHDWSVSMKQMHRLPQQSDLAYSYGWSRSGGNVWRPAALATFESEEAAAAAAAELSKGEDVLVLRYSDYLALPGGMGTGQNDKKMNPNVLEREREIICLLPGKDNTHLVHLSHTPSVPVAAVPEKKLPAKATKEKKDDGEEGDKKKSGDASNGKAKTGEQKVALKIDDAQQRTLSLVLVCWLKSNKIKWNPEDAKALLKYFMESCRGVVHVRIHPKYTSHFFMRFNSAEEFAVLQQVKYKGIDVLTKPLLQHDFAANASVLKLVLAKEKALARIVAELAEASAPHAPKEPATSKKHGQQADLRQKLSAGRGQMGPMRHSGVYSAPFAPYGYRGPAASGPWMAPQPAYPAVPGLANIGAVLAQQVGLGGGFLPGAAGANTLSNSNMRFSPASDFMEEKMRLEMERRMLNEDKIRERQFGSSRNRMPIAAPLSPEPASDRRSPDLDYVAYGQGGFNARLPRSSDRMTGPVDRDLDEVLDFRRDRFGGRGRAEIDDQRNRGYGGEQRSSESSSQQKEECGLIFSGFSSELSGGVILDILQAEQGVSARDVKNLEWNYQNGKITFQVALGLPTRAVVDVMNHWNRRPLHVGSDIIKANIYSTSTAGQLPPKRSPLDYYGDGDSYGKKSRLGMMSYA